MTQFPGIDGRKLTSLLWVPTLGLPLLFAGCSGASSSAGAVGTTSGPFALSQISVSNGAVWQINRPIQFTFSVAVDFDTVNLNTINIQRLNGAPAVGEFSEVAGDPRSVLFQPVCPRKDDFSDAGFQPGGVTYQVNVPTESSGATTVRSQSGKALTSGFTLNFKTPTTSVLADLFLDPLPGPARPVISAGTGTSMTVGNADEGATEVETFFEFDMDGLGVLPGGMKVANNFYSDPGSQIALRIRFDQPVSPRVDNINSTRLVMQYHDDIQWIPLTTEVFLESNCVGTGASVRVTPVGILPQGRLMRLVVSPEFEDLVGDRNPSPVDKFALMDADSVTEGGVPVETADEVLDEYLDTKYQDVGASLAAPSADWGGGSLQAAFAFDGTGGPGTQFDLRIPPNSDVVFDTTSTLFIGGPNFEPQFTQLAVNGRLDVRNLEIPASSTLRIQGPNPATILATGYVLIEGRLSADGGSAAPVFTLNTPTQPESGGAGQAGGGAGGTGSFLTNQVTPRGGNGQGAFGTPNFGGEGGEAGWSSITSGNGVSRRAAGGGGGVFGHDQMVAVGAEECEDQEIYGLDAENGFPGHDSAESSQGQHIPYGGHEGPGPFGILPGEENDFYGTKVQGVGGPSEVLITGELLKATGGSGGGAGGDATFVPAGASYPPNELVNNHQDKGAGGGGGAGALTILALGDITVTGTGKISAIGGFGSGGENTAGVNRVGGGSGGGSGGHIILQTAGRIDLSGTSSSLKAIDARGGQGGEGAGGAGGANDHETNSVNADAKHIGSNNGTDNPFDFLTTVCRNALTGSLVVRAAGGDGGPGLVQLHVGDLGSDILYPTNEASLRGVVQPVPHGYDAIDAEWDDHLLPIFGRFSMSQSVWIPLGEATVDPDNNTPGDLAFLFGGTDVNTGEVESTNLVVDDLAPILTEGAPTLDPSDPTDRTLLMDAGGLAASDAIYTRNPNLLRNFNLSVGGDPYYITSASYDSGADEFALTVDPSGPDFAGAMGAVELRPRYFGITTSGIQNFLPSSSSVMIEFDLLGVDPDDESATSTTGFVPNLAGEDLNALGIDPNHIVRFMRYRVTFDITQGTADLDANTPLPRLDFLRLPFKF